jgi:hypothetical protein
VNAFVAAVCVLVPALAAASPNVDLGDPRYDELATYYARGLLPLYRGGYAPMTEARMRRLLVASPLPRDVWFRVDRALLRLAWDADRPRPYSTSYRPRQIAGAVALTCEHDEGRPCGGTGTLGEVDASAGYADYASATVRLRANAGTQGYDEDVGVDRLYAIGEIGPVAVGIGRDVLVVGPRSRTQLGWGDNAAPLDHVRISTSEPFALTDDLDANVLYAVARLRDPQTFDGTLLTISRVQLDIADKIEVGVQQLLQLGGDGAAPIGGPVDFVLEHIRRRDKSASATDSSNRRFGGDVSWRIRELWGARLYYQLMFEDIRRARWIDAVRYDADHLWGVEVAGVVVEYHQTGVRSGEHSSRLTGMTNAGYVGGSPLGPDAKSIYVRARVWHVEPWFERASVGSGEYLFVENGPITLVRPGRHEFRTRLGADARFRLGHDVFVEPHAAVERVENFGFQRGTTRWNGRLAVDVVWRPR